MVDDDILKSLNETPPDLSLILSTDWLHPLKQILPYVVGVDPLVALADLAASQIFTLLPSELGGEVGDVHEHRNGCQVRIYVFVVWLSETLDAIEDVHEVFLT